MKLPSITAFRSLDHASVWARDLVAAISASWRVEHGADGQHTFGASAVPFVAGHYTGSGSMTWTVAGGNVTTNRAGRLGPWLAWTLEVSGTTVGGVVSTNLRVQLPFSLRAKGRQAGTFKYLDAGTDGTGVWIVTDGSNVIQLFTDYTLAAWTAGTTAIIGQFVIEVQ